MTTFSIFPFRQLCAASTALFVVGIAAAQKPASLAPPVTPTVSGKFVGNGKNVAIKFLTVEEHEPFNDKDAITLIFTEKNPAGAKKPSFDAVFGKLGSALILNVHHDGGIFGCQVAHSAHEKQGFSSIGQIKMLQFESVGGNVKGRVSTGKELDTFGEKWEVDLAFAAPLPAKLRNAAPVPRTNQPATAPKSINSGAEPAQPLKKDPKPAGPLIAARKLPLPKDATNVDFKATVKQIHFSSAQPLDALTREFSANLKQQGWKDGAGSLVGRQNTILKREQGDAKLTIMIRPAGTGSTVTIFTEGLDWSSTGDLTPPPSSTKAAADSSEDAIEAEAQKLLKEALKNVPKGF